MNAKLKNNILVTLKILSKIEENDKIFINSINNNIQIEKYYYFQSVYRYFNNQSRINTIQYLNDFYNKLENIIHNTFNQKHMNINYLTENFNNNSNNDSNNDLNKDKIINTNLLFYYNDKENLMNIKQELDKSVKGLNNLNKTYQNDQNINTNINIIIERNNELSNHIQFNLDNLKIYYQNISNSINAKNSILLN